MSIQGTVRQPPPQCDVGSKRRRHARAHCARGSAAAAQGGTGTKGEEGQRAQAATPTRRSTENNMDGDAQGGCSSDAGTCITACRRRCVEHTGNNSSTSGEYDRQQRPSSGSNMYNSTRNSEDSTDYDGEKGSGAKVGGRQDKGGRGNHVPYSCAGDSWSTGTARGGVDTPPHSS